MVWLVEINVKPDNVTRNSYVRQNSKFYIMVHGWNFFQKVSGIFQPRISLLIARVYQHYILTNCAKMRMIIFDHAI